MIGWRAAAAALVVVATALSGCARTVEGAATWPGARLESAIVTAADFPPGVQYDRIPDNPGQVDGQGGPPAMLSSPEGCSDGLTRVIAASAERGAGSAAKYVVAYDGARIVMTVVSWPLDLDGLDAVAQKCARFQTYFDRSSQGIPMTTTRLESPRSGALAYQQTMQLGTEHSSVYFSFENVGASAVFGIALPTPNPTIAVKATLPQTFMEIVAKQGQRLE
ncbi:hypothetical protein CIW52_21990 [Mycolicibacterium sp. P9-64]|uniref:hypothetical protein n=1 Tax=Mycolicibacterium sp. P9-64 TaxID=2024612 RepID=UPI0011ED81F9|nr:hypothetical protein [Mycolicibacterium sp. P9-64]KAA0081282.1 hypothetical protein CIW52_21990 [Mycolicibacterium sp. P9-64]